MRIITILAALAGAGTLAGCGETLEQRAATGALGGAVAGEVVAGDPLLGAAAGGAAGAAGVGEAVEDAID